MVVQLVSSWNGRTGWSLCRRPAREFDRRSFARPSFDQVCGTVERSNSEGLFRPLARVSPMKASLSGITVLALEQAVVPFANHN